MDISPETEGKILERLSAGLLPVVIARELKDDGVRIRDVMKFVHRSRKKNGRTDYSAADELFAERGISDMAIAKATGIDYQSIRKRRLYYSEQRALKQLTALVRGVKLRTSLSDEEIAELTDGALTTAMVSSIYKGLWVDHA